MKRKKSKLLINAGTFKVLSKPDDVIKDIASAARTCYQSDKNSSPESDQALVKAIINRGHHAMLEMADMKVVFSNVSRGFTHEMVRHRLASFAQECVVGETKILDGTIEELYSYKINKNLFDLSEQNIIINSINEFGKIINNKVIDVIKKEEIRKVFQIETKLGYKLTCTGDHEIFYEINNSKKLKNLSIGDTIIVNGKYIYEKLSKEELEKLYKIYNPKEISHMTSIPYRSIVRQLKDNGLFISHKNDKEKWKYNKNHTKESYIQMKKTIKEQYKNGREVWNKNIKENENISVKKQANSLRENHHNNGYEENNSNWKNGISVKYYQRLKKDIDYCELCKTHDEKLEIHHIDKNRKNNNIDNLIKLCFDCHTMVHNKDNKFLSKNIVKDTIISIKELKDKRVVYDLVMQNPYNNYIANGIMVHNSTRYLDERGFDIVIPPHQGDFDNMQVVDSHKDSEDLFYQYLRNNGWKAEDARQFLPIGMANEIVVKANIREWRHIFTMRCDHYAHWEIRGLMLQLLKWCHENIPLVFDDFHFFTKGEKEYARRVLSKKELKEVLDHYDQANPNTLKYHFERMDIK
jgi:thymidylate synthase ThyX